MTQTDVKEGGNPEHLHEAEKIAKGAGQQLAHESLIVVNGRQREIKGNIISFEEVVKIAFPNGPSRDDIKYSVTYGNALKPHHDGELDPGQKVVVKPGHNPHEETSFCVTETILS